MARRSSSAKARRLVALLGQLRPDSRIPLSRLAALLGVSEAEIASDLETLSLCGVAPYDPFGLVPVFVDGDEVVVFGQVPAVRGGIRLSVAEAEALAAALQAAGFGAEDPLTRRLLDAAASEYPADEIERILRSQVGGHAPAVYEALAEGAAHRVLVEIEHVSTGAEETRCRFIEPVALFAERGAWYVTSWCRLAGGWRTFRLDRIRAARLTSEVFAEHESAASGEKPGRAAALDTSRLPRARLRFSPEEPYSEREWPGSVPAGREADGALLVDVPFAGTDWVARHVAARLGRVEVVAPAEIRSAVRALAEAASLAVE